MYECTKKEQILVNFVRKNFNSVPLDRAVENLDWSPTVLKAVVKKSAILSIEEGKITLDLGGVLLPIPDGTERELKAKLLFILLDGKNITYFDSVRVCNSLGRAVQSRGAFDVLKSELKRKYFFYI